MGEYQEVEIDEIEGDIQDFYRDLLEDHDRNLECHLLFHQFQLLGIQPNLLTPLIQLVNFVPHQILLPNDDEELPSKYFGIFLIFFLVRTRAPSAPVPKRNSICSARRTQSPTCLARTNLSVFNCNPIVMHKFWLASAFPH